MSSVKRWSGTISVAVAVCAVAALLARPWSSSEAPTVSCNGPKFNDMRKHAMCTTLAGVLPDSVYSEQHPVFGGFMGNYWSNNAAEVIPACIVQPVDAHEVAAAVVVLQDHFDADGDARFAVRSGGHSPEAGFAGVADGVVIDMSLIDEVTVDQDRQSTMIGVGARWRDVYSKLDAMGLAMVGGRNANVGVGGLVLGGGISFFSPRFGMVCDNIDKYEVVLANGSIVEATAHQHADIWQALKGGSGNFGIVTRVTTKIFPSGKIWAGYGYWLDWQTPKVIKAFFDFNKPESFDAYAGGPIMALAYVRDLGIRMTVTNLSYSRPVNWAPVFAAFKSIWRLWSTTKVQSLTDATTELHGMAPVGQRQFQVTTTIKNDLATFEAFNQIFTEQLKKVKPVKRSMWSLVFQPLSAAVTRKGSPNVLGMETRYANDTLIIVLLCVSWREAKDDEIVHRVSRDVIRLGSEYAEERGTSDPYVYLNYAASGQDVFSGYGFKNEKLMQDVRLAYDPTGLFQQAKQGGFKLAGS
ncbi:Putative FAD-binding domain, PCMH-type, FAD-binding, type PCMH, subdomain 2 [Septoria linicola]|uniref:FAD-binding domain, PCMH-type, FAD-binding, type PCMH, subdomain 2 n=1 Tax=Septoria linicola TaxID=215465 RepID=A0A9Q9EMM4_9PEZI|nr:Putative FAD-binding domain, PCMH-type, FAD-binding, type PCMH, subdomain 2 [Septoria linicola]